MTDISVAASGAPERVSEAPSLAPPTDIYETKDAIIMLLDMPGADPETLNVTLEQRVLAVSARSISTTPQGYTPVLVEYQDGNYGRSFTLSDLVDEEHIDAVFKDGVLRLTLPKVTPGPPKKITVKSA
jgi:HSP20 family protein